MQKFTRFCGKVAYLGMISDFSTSLRFLFYELISGFQILISVISPRAYEISPSVGPLDYKDNKFCQTGAIERKRTLIGASTGHGKDVIIILSNSAKNRLALRFENPIFTACRTSFIAVHLCRVFGNPLIQRTSFGYKKVVLCIA